MLNAQATQEDRDALRLRLGLDKPVVVQFFVFLGRAVQGDFGISYRNQQEVMSLIAERFPATLELVLVSAIVALLIGIPLGVFVAIKRGNPFARLLHIVSMIGVSVPAFVIGIMLILVFFRHAGLAARLWPGRGDGPGRLVHRPVDPHRADRADHAGHLRSPCSRSPSSCGW